MISNRDIRHSAFAPKRLRRTGALALAASLLAFSACTDFLIEKPRDLLTIDNFYQSDADVRSAIAAVYRPLSDLGLYGTAMKSALIMAADDGRVGPREVNAAIIAASSLEWNSTTPRVTHQPWGGWYDIVTKSNTLIENLPGADNISETVKSQVIGEAKFLRALGYFTLVRLWGDVPLVLTAEQQVGLPARTPKAEIFEQIIRDATEAEAALPLEWPTSEKGRAPKGAAQTLLADVYLWLSSAEGENDWQLAADAAKRVIDSDVYELVPDYLQAFRPGSQFRSEEIFAAQATNVANGPEVRAADMFYPQEMGANTVGGFAAALPLPWSYNAYAPGDYRHDVTYFTSGQTVNGTTVTFEPHVYKYRPTARPGPQDTNWPIYRYAEVLLFYAEALNELDRPAEAITYLNMVRARARNGTGSENRAEPADYSGTLDKAMVRDTIIDERRIETVFEGDRWFDIIRRGPDYFMAALARDSTATGAAPNKRLWPIPQTELNANPNLVQNPGY